MQTKWGDHLRLSVDQMDREHGEVIAQAKWFSVAVEAKLASPELALRLTQLIACFQKHFDSEEAMMRSSSFPGLNAHMAEHRKLIEQVSVLRDGLVSGGVSVCDALALFMRLWTEQHITGADTNFANFLHAEKSLCRTDLVSIGQ